jgi:glucokinase
MTPSAAVAAPWLLADVRGTNVRFALAQTSAPTPLLMESIRAYRVADFVSLADAAKSYLRAVDVKPANAVFALAGRVTGTEVQMTNHSWAISAPQIRDGLALASLTLVNDFAALSMGLPLLIANDMVAIGPEQKSMTARASTQTFCVLGPGTGLGVAALTTRGEQAIALQTEGGHASFAPGTPEEIEILKRLMFRFGRVSNERLVCGSGLVNLYQAQCEISRVIADPLAPEDVTARAQLQSDPLCRRAVELFCAILGSIAGDLALTFGAWDGVYLAGGLLLPLLPWLKQGTFRQRFEDKGRFSAAMRQVPVAVITHRQPGLLGAAGIAVVEAGLPLLRAAHGVAGQRA